MDDVSADNVSVHGQITVAFPVQERLGLVDQRCGDPTDHHGVIAQSDEGQEHLGTRSMGETTYNRAATMRDRRLREIPAYSPLMIALTSRGSEVRRVLAPRGARAGCRAKSGHQ